MGIRSTDLKVAAMIASVVALCTALRTGPVHVTELEPGDRVVLDYVSKGCFATTRARITLTPEPGGALRYRSAVRGRGVRTGVLDARDAGRLEAHLQGFREFRPGGCSTSRSVSVALHRGARMVRRERETDRSCFDTQNPDVLSIYDLLPDSRPASSD